MSVLNFIKDVGANLFGKGKKETEAVKELLDDIQELKDRLERLEQDLKEVGK